MGVRRGRGEGSIQQLEDGRWKAWLSLGKNAAGKRRRMALYGKTKQEVQKKLRELLGQRDRGLLADCGKITCGEWFTRWLNLVKPDLADGTHENYEGHVRNHLTPHLGTVTLARLDRLQVADLYQRLAAAGVSDAMRAKLATTLRTSLKRAVELGLIAVNPAQAVRKPRAVKQADVRVWTGDEPRRFREACHGHRLEALFVLALDSGMRQGELFGQLWDAADLDAGTVHVLRSLQDRDGHHKLKETKTRASRRKIKLSPETVALLRVRRDQAERDGHFGPDRPVFTDTGGGFLRKQNVQRRAFYPLMKKAKLPVIRFHYLRHTAATRWLLDGASIKAVSARLGHSNIRTTLDTYCHFLPEMDDRIAESSRKMLFAGEWQPIGNQEEEADEAA